MEEVYAHTFTPGLMEVLAMASRSPEEAVHSTPSQYLVRHDNSPGGFRVEWQTSKPKPSSPDPVTHQAFLVEADNSLWYWYLKYENDRELFRVAKSEYRALHEGPYDHLMKSGRGEPMTVGEIGMAAADRMTAKRQA